jgi:hypothetical protein
MHAMLDAGLRASRDGGPMFRKLTTAVIAGGLAALFALSVVGCVPRDYGQPSNAPINTRPDTKTPKPPKGTIYIVGALMQPSKLTVKQNDIIEIRNADKKAHDVKIGPDKVGSIPAGGTASITAMTKGTFLLVDAANPKLKATIIVK